MFCSYRFFTVRKVFKKPRLIKSQKRCNRLSKREKATPFWKRTVIRETSMMFCSYRFLTVRQVFKKPCLIKIQKRCNRLSKREKATPFRKRTVIRETRMMFCSYRFLTVRQVFKKPRLIKIPKKMPLIADYRLPTTDCQLQLAVRSLQIDG